MRPAALYQGLSPRVSYRILHPHKRSSLSDRIQTLHLASIMTTAPTPPITIVGAGVLGLSAATVLQKRYPKSRVTLIAAETPTLPVSWTNASRPSADYASMWAGAHFRPIPRSTRQLYDEADLAYRTAEVMFEIAKESPEAGVASMPAKEYLEDPPKEYASMKTGDRYGGPVDQFRVLDKTELPDGVQFGCEYQAYCVNVHVYCSWLFKNFIGNGGKLVKKTLKSINEAFDQPDAEAATVVINCSGTNFNQDPKMQLIRGQTVLVKNTYHSTVTRQTSDGGWSFLIPRPGGGGTVVGGTKEIGDTETEARPETRQKLLAAAVQAFPDFVDDPSKFDVVMDNVGRRPWREGGLRIEVEPLSDSTRVIHCYGAGGRGYELSWGVAEQTADLYSQSLSQ